MQKVCGSRGYPYPVGPERDLSPALCAAAHVAVVAHVAEAVGELGLEADLARAVHLHAGLLLQVGALPNLRLQPKHLLLLLPERKLRLSTRNGNVIYRTNACVDHRLGGLG